MIIPIHNCQLAFTNVILRQVAVFLCELSGVIQVGHGVRDGGDSGHDLLTAAVWHVQ